MLKSSPQAVRHRRGSTYTGEAGGSDGGRHSGSPIGGTLTPPVPLLRVRRAVGLVAGSIVLPLIALFALTIGLYGDPVPTANEAIYTLLPYRAWHPEFLVNDWTFSTMSDPHRVFHALIGLPMLVWSPEAVTVTGRLITWGLLLVALLRVGRRLGLPYWATAIVIAIWLGHRQSVVGAEWIFGGFEAKVVAYVAFFFALERFLGNRPLSGALLLGLTGLLHQPVGFAGAVGVGAALLCVRTPWREVARVLIVTLLVASPGLIAALMVTSGASAAAEDGWRFITLVVMPFHFDPVSFTRSDVLVLGLMLAFCFARAAERRSDRVSTFVGGLLLGMTLLFLGGVAARSIGWFAPLQVTPFRVVSLIVIPLFLLIWLRTHLVQREAPSRLAVVLGLLALMWFADPLVQIRDRLHARASHAVRQDDLAASLVWVAHNTPEDVVVISPPWRKDAYFLSRRAQIATWELLPLRHLEEWRARIESLVGPLPEDVHGTGSWRHRHQVTRSAMLEGYGRLTDAEISTLAARHGARYLVHDGAFDLPVLFATDTYKVYGLSGAENSLSASP